jgi:hypothetical protein
LAAIPVDASFRLRTVAWTLVASWFAVLPVAARVVVLRGDSDCNAVRSAADVVAATRGFGGMSSCDQDDCDRDGAVTAADVDCTARCLFNLCPIPPDAPQVSAAVPDSTAALTPLSVARITGINFGDETEPAVTIGGMEAEIVDFSPPDTILVIVPNVEPGPADVVVLAGGVAGPPLPLAIEPAARIGEADTFEGTLALLEMVIESVLALDLSFAGEDEAFLRAEIARLRDEIAADIDTLLAAPELTAELRAALDAAIDASDIPERLRAELGEPLAASPDFDEGGGAQVPAARAKAVTIRAAAGAIKTLVSAAPEVAAGAGGIAIAPIAIGVGIGATIIGGVLVAANDPLTPLITGLRFRDSEGRMRRFPTGNGTVEIMGARFDSFTTSLRFDFYNGLRLTRPIEVQGDGTAVARVGNVNGLCGFVNLVLTRTVADSNPAPTRIQPELLSVDPTVALPSQNISVLTRGASLCGGTVRYKIGTFEVGSSTLPPLSTDTFPVAAPAARPGFVQVELQTGPLVAEETRTLEIKTAVTGLAVRCRPAEVELKLPRVTVSCFASFLPEGVDVPSDLTLDWGSTNGDVLSFASALGPNLADSTFRAEGPGTARVIAQISTPAGPIRGMSEDITVVDREAPFVGLVDAPQVPIEAGTSFTVTAFARDEGFVTRIVLRAMGDAAVEAEQEIPCIESDCFEEFRVNLKESGFQQRTVTLVAEAFDGSGNSRMSNTVTVRVRDRDTTPPVVQIQAPLDGGRVRAGDTVQVSARLTDNGPNDAGVAIVRVEVAGAAVAAGPTPADLELEMPLGVATRIAPFTVKSAQELANIPDRRITITVTGADGSGNMASATATVTVGLGPVINTVTPNPAVAGSAVRVIGDGFGENQGNSTITFGGVPSPGASWSNTEIVATIPEEASGMVPVVVTVDGQASPAATLTVLGTGDVRITLVWDDTNDLDLHVIDPNGEEIFFDNPISTSGGRLDVDANAGCSGTTSSPRENIFWPTGLAPTGTYTVRVVYFRGCTKPPVSSAFTVNAIVDGVFMTLIEGSIGGGEQRATFTRGGEGQ